MASRLTTNQEIAGSTPAVVILLFPVIGFRISVSDPRLREGGGPEEDFVGRECEGNPPMLLEHIRTHG